MAPSRADDFSDSDEEDRLDEIETDVLLGIPDGDIETPSDLIDAAVSRIGGLPALLPRCEPSISSSQCRICSYPMELLVQLWSPFENSVMDRALYVWGCSRGSCQRKDGSIRAWRGLRYNADYAKKLKKSKEAAIIKQAAIQKKGIRQIEQQASTKSNPFKLGSADPAPSPFGLGVQIFGGAEPAVNSDQPGLEAPAESENKVQPEPPLSSSPGSPTCKDEEESLVVALASTSLEESAWTSAPSYKPIYLSTTGEYIPPAPKLKAPPVSDGLDGDSLETGSGSLGIEAYEDSIETDHIFDRFSKRVSYEGEQCIRYELNGTPLPYAKDAVFERLFRVPATSTISVTRGAFDAAPTSARRSYRNKNLPTCPRCNGPRAFECQLMPNLLNVLKGTTNDVHQDKEAPTDDERRKEVENLLKGGRVIDAEKRGMEWGTCMVFSCAADCCLSDTNKMAAEECWSEELVMVQWDE